MAITAINEVWRGESFSDSKDGSREYTAIYMIHTDSEYELWSTIRAALPLPGAAFADDSAALVTDRTGRRDEQSRFLWHAEVTYKREVQDEVESPLDRPAKIRWTSALITKPVLRDLNGDACVNSAGDYFDPPLEAEFPRWTANIQFNAASVPVSVLQYAGAINNAPVTIDGLAVDAERARVIALDISEVQEENGIEFRSVTLAVECRDAADDSFDTLALDQGYRIKDGTDLKDILIEDEDGNKARPSAPVLLDGSGAKLADPSPGNAVFLEFEIPRRLDLTIFTGIT